jgi:hypothetical protein
MRAVHALVRGDQTWIEIDSFEMMLMTLLMLLMLLMIVDSTSSTTTPTTMTDDSFVLGLDCSTQCKK